MRREFFAGVSRYFVTRYCPWACKIVKVDGGYLAFESIEDWRTWRTWRRQLNQFSNLGG